MFTMRGHEQGRRRARGHGAALALAMLTVALMLLLHDSVAGVAHADGGFTEITGNPVQVEISHPDANGNMVGPATVPSLLLNALGPQAQAFTQQPFNQFFDSYWAGTPDNNGQTMRDRSCTQATNAVAQQVKVSAGQNAYNIHCSFATTGKLSAAVQNGDAVVLSYYLSNNSVDFYTTQGTFCGSECDPHFNISFDVEVQFTVIYGDPCLFLPDNVPAAIYLHNTSISAENFWGGIADIVDAVNQALGSNDTFQSAEARLDDTAQYFYAGSNLTDPLTAACKAAAGYGFSHIDFQVDPNAHTLAIVFTHPPIPAPDVAVQSADTPNLFGQGMITVSPTELQAGAQVGTTVSGSYFTPPSSSGAITLTWNGLGYTTEFSNLQWGPQGQQQQQLKLQTTSFAPSTLAPNTTYQFSVQNCQQLVLLTMCSPYSAPTTGRTAAAGTGQVNLSLDDGTALGSATVRPDGTFSMPITLPASVSCAPAPGKAHSIVAKTSGYSTSTGITVVCAGKPLSPQIQWQGVAEATDPFTIVGFNFQPGQVQIRLDSANGQLLGTATADQQGNFTYHGTLPYDVAGERTFWAVEVSQGQTLQASLTQFVQALPR